MLCESFLRLDLVDEIRLMIAPILLGDGLRFFGNFSIERRWQLKDSVAYKNGFVALRYGRPSVKMQP
jgi:dihydrofolate reductase